jgi:hypothetical protein|tara:strand:- start:136 stop:327 length:192 start_codon:yes stop_codon:yes gene_type:complete
MVMNIFSNPGSLKKWSLNLSDACGSIITNVPPNVKEIDKLVDQFVVDYNENMEKANASEKETS